MLLEVELVVLLCGLQGCDEELLPAKVVICHQQHKQVDQVLLAVGAIESIKSVFKLALNIVEEAGNTRVINCQSTALF